MPRTLHTLLLTALLLAAAACERALTTPGAPSASGVAPSPTSLVPIELPGLVPAADSSMLTDFSEYLPGVAPQGWTQVWDPTSHFTVADEPSVPGGRVLQWSATGQSRNRWGLAYDGLGDRTDQSVYTEVRVRSLGGGSSTYYMGAAAVRMSGTATDEHGYVVFLVAVPSTGSTVAVLSTWTGGAYVQLGSYAIDWQLDQWYAVRLEAVGSAIRARIWPRGAAEPADWQLVADDGRYPSGRPGVANHDNGTVQWTAWQATAAPPLPPPPPTPPITAQHQFTAGAAWAPPAGWTESSAPENSAWTVAADLGVQDGRALRNVITATGRHILRLDATPDTVRDQEMLVKLRMADSDDRGPGVALRHSMAATAATAYVAYLRPGLDQVEINRFLNGGWQFMASASVPNDPGPWYWMRFRAQGSQVMVRVWADGQPEPAGWTSTASDGAAIPTGTAGLYTYEPNTVEYDLVAYASGGATAPTPPPGTQSPVAMVRVTPDSATVAQGGTLQYAANGTLANGDSVAVPVAWSTTGGTVTSGGVFTAGTALGTFQVSGTVAGGGMADVADVTVVAAPPTESYTTTFASLPTGAQPAGWTRTSAPAGVVWTVQADAGVPDGAVLRSVTTTTARHILAADGISPAAGDQEVLARLRMGDDDGRGPGVALRHTMNGSLETAYVAYFRPATNQVEVNRFLSGGWKFVAAATFVNDPGVWYWIRFRAQGTTLKARVWADGTPEPSTWQIVSTDDGIATGGVGVYTYEPNTVDFDGFSAVRGTGTAVTP